MIFVLGWGLATIAIFLCGLSPLAQFTLLALAVTIMLVSAIQASHIKTIQIDQQSCILQISDGRLISITPPYRSAQFIGWISIYQPRKLWGRWYWLYRDQFTPEEWRTLSVLIHWAH